MKKVFISDKASMVLESMNNIDKDHTLYNSFYEVEVADDFHVNVFGNAVVYDNAVVFDNAKVFGNAVVFDEWVIE